MVQRVFAAVVMLVVLTTGALGLARAAAPSVAASPNVTSEPGWVDLRIRIEPDEANRELIVELDSENFFRSSSIALAGDESPTMHWLRFDRLPAGKYVVRASVERSGGGRLTGVSQFLVAGRTEGGI